MSKYYWIPDNAEVWILGVEIPNSIEPSGNSKFKIISTNKIVSSRHDLCLDAPDCDNDNYSLLSPEDLISLPSINQAAILNSTRLRFNDKNIYTSLGSVLMLLNPFKRIDKLYGQSVLNKYKNPFAENLPSHIYLVPSRAYSKMCTYGKDQSILISGESGAGKTEATKECLAWLTTFAGTAPMESKSSKASEKILIESDISGVKQESAVNIAKKIIASSPILEAFGNAQTIRNPNSSRFGKWMQLTFDKSNWITGSSIVSYLLEQSRVTAHNLKERNYHIFYQILRGASNEKLNELYLNSNTIAYKYLSMDNGEEALDFEDADKYEEMIESFQNMGFDNHMIDDVLKIVAAVLHLGNLNFKDENNGESCEITKCSEIKYLSDLLSISIESLERALCTRSITSGRKSIITIQLNSEKACDSRDSLARALYDKLFKDIIVLINNNSKIVHVSKSTKGSKYIGLLDIFGFEIFQNNSFEQLCINYCNEILQNHFNFVIFEAEKALYLEEGISCDTIECKDNLPTIQGIQSLFKSLDEEGRIPKGSSKTWFDKIRRSYATPKAKTDAVLTFSQRKDSFTVTHYAGEVEYIPSLFLEKNIETIYNDLITTMQSSSSTVIQRLFQTSAEEADQKSKVGNKTISWRFQSQLTSLMTMLRETDSHFIRCIKSNDGCKPLVFDSQLVQRQLLYSGIFEVVQIQQSGLPCRFTHEDFLNNFKCLVETKQRWGKKTSTCENLMSYLKTVRNMKLELYEIGKSIIFMKANENQILERAKGLIHNKSAISIQKCARMSTPYKIYNKLINNLHEMNSKIQNYDIPALTNNYKLIDEYCNAFNAICGYNILNYISIQQYKILQKTIAQKDVLDELQTTSKQRSHIGFEKLESVIKKAHELDLKDHRIVIQCQILVIGFKNAVTFIKNINNQSEISELSLGDIKVGIDNLKEFSDILPLSLPTLDLAAERKKNVEHELEVIFKKMLACVERSAVMYDKETANLIPVNTKDYADESSLKDIMNGINFDTLLCKDTRSLYRDIEVFLQLLNDYIPREAAEDALTYISKQNIFTDFISSQLRIISQWAEIQMSAQAMKKALSVGYVPGTSLGTETPVIVDDVKKILDTLSNFVNPSAQIVIVIMVGQYIIKWREAFINKDWILLNEICTEVKEEFIESDNIFDEFEESIQEIKNCDEQVMYNNMLANMLMIFDKPEISIIPVETLDVSNLKNNYEYFFNKITIAKEFISNSMQLLGPDGTILASNRDTQEREIDSDDEYDDNLTELKSIWPILVDLIPVCEDMLDLRMQLHVLDLDRCLVLCSSLLSQKYSRIIKKFSIFDFIDNEIKFCNQIIVLVKAERVLHQEMLNNQTLSTIYSNNDDIWKLESSSQLSVENSITCLRTAIAVINDLEESQMQKTLYSSILPNSLIDKRNAAKKLLLGRETLSISDISDFNWNDLKKELLNHVIFLDLKNNSNDDSVIPKAYLTEFNIIINELTRRSLLQDLLTTLIILPNTLNVNGELDDYFKFDAAIYESMTKKVMDVGKSFLLNYSNNNIPLELKNLHKCCLNLQILRSYINNNDWYDENKIPGALTDILPIDIPGQYLKSKLVRDDDNTLISSIKIIWAEFNSRFYIRQLKESIPEIGFSYFIDDAIEKQFDSEEINSNSSNDEIIKKPSMINEESFKDGNTEEIEKWLNLAKLNPHPKYTSLPSAKTIELGNNVVQIVAALKSGSTTSIDESTIESIILLHKELDINYDMMSAILIYIRISHIFESLYEVLLIEEVIEKEDISIAQKIEKLELKDPFDISTTIFDISQILLIPNKVIENVNTIISSRIMLPSFIIPWIDAVNECGQMFSNMINTTSKGSWIRVVDIARSLEEKIEIIDGLEKCIPTIQNKLADILTQHCLNSFRFALDLKEKENKKNRRNSQIELDVREQLRNKKKQEDNLIDDLEIKKQYEIALKRQKLLDADKKDRYGINNLRLAGYDDVTILEKGRTRFPLLLFWAADFDCNLLRTIGKVSANKLKSVGYSCSLLRKGGFSIEQLRSGGFTSSELREAGVTIKNLSEADFSVSEILSSGFDIQAIKSAGFTASQLTKEGATALDLINAGFSVSELRAVGFSASQLRQGHLVNDPLALKNGGFDLKRLMSAGFDCASLARIGYNYTELKDNGFNEESLLGAGFVNSVSKSVLMELYDKTNGANWFNSTNWCTSEPLSTWFGIKVRKNDEEENNDIKNPREVIIEINLSNNNLYGIIPQNIHLLSKLQNLILSNNMLSGHLPNSLKFISTLKKLDVSCNNKLIITNSNNENSNINEDIDVYATEWEALMDLFHSTNGKSWKYKNKWGSERPLKEWFGISVNKLTGRVSKIQLPSNNLNGSLPDGLSVLIGLKELDLRYNQVNGQISLNIKFNTSLVHIHLHGNRLTSIIPDSIGDLVNLESLDLRSNQLTGTVPKSISNLKNLSYIGLSSNRIKVSKNELKAMLPTCRSIVV